MKLLKYCIQFVVIYTFAYLLLVSVNIVLVNFGLLFMDFSKDTFGALLTIISFGYILFILILLGEIILIGLILNTYLFPNFKKLISLIGFGCALYTLLKINLITLSFDVNSYVLNILIGLFLFSLLLFLGRQLNKVIHLIFNSSEMNDTIQRNYQSLASARIHFRKLTKQDIPSWIEFFENNDRLRFLGLDESKSFETMAEEWINKQLERYEEVGFSLLAAELKDTKEFIGMAGVIPRELEGKQELEIAYSLKPKYWGKGYATEMAQTIHEFAKENIKSNRFISIIHVENEPSMNVARKNGMLPLFNSNFMGMEVLVYGKDK